MPNSPPYNMNGGGGMGGGQNWGQAYSTNDNTSAPTMSVFHAGDENQRLGAPSDTHSPPMHPSGNTMQGSPGTGGPGNGGFFGWMKKGEPEKHQILDDGTTPTGDEKPKHESVEEVNITFKRRIWEGITWFLTWWIPTPLLTSLGKMKRPDVRMAWREKVAICIIILFLWLLLLFIIVGLGFALCPPVKVWGNMEVQGYSTQDKAWVYLRGSVYDITSFIKMNHGGSKYPTGWSQMRDYVGKDVNQTFPIPIRVACPGLGEVNDDKNYDNFFTVSEDDKDPTLALAHSKRGGIRSTETDDPFFYPKTALPKLKLFRKGDLVWEKKYVDHMHKKVGKYWRIINDSVYNFDDYFSTINRADYYKDNKQFNFLSSTITDLLNDGGGYDTDITELWTASHLRLSNAEFNRVNNCINNAFYVGKVDKRHSVKCLFANYMLLAFACVLMFVILSKFLAAMQFGTKKRPLPPMKHVLCQVPCYTENEDSLEITLSSLAALDYNDKSKLIFVICDGNIVGHGNDRPTPRIVLDILGVDPEYDPPARDYLAIAEGSRRHNRAKVYSGLYEYEGHVVPYMVVAKVGTPEETSRAGNRGKRDSQIILMQFLNKVHFDLPMTPLELEMYHQMKHIIGIPPDAFEYILQIDADTHVMEDSLTRLVSACTSDSRIAGICGETMLGNENRSFTTMIQVYEYFISHHMAKAFESLFGSVTCLPGCFCMYRIRTKQGKPLLISNPVVEGYSELHVDTLHKKNLLSLGEDRYLTTLMMKHFPTSKYKFIRDAKCQTIAPEKWSILLSQRRRWINSTIHNLVELLYLPDMCGFCCFSMRFVVFIDLFSTLTMPTTLIYFAILIYLTVADITSFSYISLILIGAIYGLQAVIFILRREWQHIGWMIIYLLAYPLWSFVLPIYSFWHFDDFSWGNTRVVVGEGKRKLLISDDRAFDPNSIPQRRWTEYEQELVMYGLLNAPPPNMNENASHDERMSASSHLSRPMSTIPPNQMMGVPGSASATPVPMPMDPRLSAAMGSSMGFNQPMMPTPNYDPRLSRAMGVTDGIPPMTPQGSMPPQIYGQPGIPPVGYSMPPSTSSMYIPPTVSTPIPYNSNLQGGGTPGMMQSGLLPNDEELTEAIRVILNNSDLQTITKKKVREQLSAQYGVDLTHRKEFIGDAIELILNGQL
ncbi:hypothetical protein H4219_003390 [Mycoemilia scoparia]|uniref:chitin synthase n=1 Tax=Mycoemilia scoparia TaxID=417184 RepID=A0A9W7ZUX6_9FUNG|nr:hypothetical protein H4219_003390 [Mycoemilia scoparia]